MASEKIEPFRVEVPDEVIADLRARLGSTRFPDEVPDTAWEYGTNLAYLKELVEYWRDEVRLARASSASSIASRISRRASTDSESISSTKRARGRIRNRCC